MNPVLANVPRLNELYLYVTNGCNCACRHCWIVPPTNDSNKASTTFLDAQLLERAIEEALPLGLSSLKWTGGEPTIHPEFVRLLQIQKKYGLNGRMETNGMLLTPALAKELVGCGVKDVSVSLDGASAATHDYIRNAEGGFAKTLSGVRALSGAGCQPELIMSLMRCNLEEVESFLRLAQELNVGSVKFNVVQPSLRGADLHDRDEVPSIRELLTLQERIVSEWQNLYDFSILLDVPLAFRPLSEILSGRAMSRCGIFGILGLLADGHFALCGVGEHESELVFGSAGCGELAEIWRSHPLLTRLRDELPGGLQGICARCLMRGTCLGSCVATNYQHGRDLLAPFWFCEQAQAEGVFPEGRLES